MVSISKQPSKNILDAFVLYFIVFIMRSSDPYKANTHRIFSLSYTKMKQRVTEKNIR